MDEIFLERLCLILRVDREIARRIAASFLDVDGLKSASVDEIASRLGVHRDLARRILAFARRWPAQAHRTAVSTVRDAPMQPDDRLCGSCGAWLHAEDSSCAVCGSPVGTGSTAPAARSHKGVGRDLVIRWQRSSEVSPPSTPPAQKPGAVPREPDQGPTIARPTPRKASEATRRAAKPKPKRKASPRGAPARKRSPEETAPTVSLQTEMARATPSGVTGTLRDVHRTTVSPTPTTVCPACGASLGAEDKFCSNCSVMETVEPPLRTERTDLDARFARASVLARMARWEEAAQALSEVARLDLHYPGLWTLKARVYEHLGRPKMAESCRARARDLRGKGKHSELALRNPPSPPAPLAPARAESQFQRAAPRGLQTRPPTPAGRRAGETNGLRDRVNGLGIQRGRTNGRVNGRGRTNGLVNGKGRVNGLVNGYGRVNGLVNGMGWTNGLFTRRGRTNGIVNGVNAMRANLADGITNGVGFTNGLGGARLSREIWGQRWKLSVIPVVAALLLLSPMFLIFGPVSEGPIAIDGHFQDWDGIVKGPSAQAPSLNPNIDIVRFGITMDSDRIAVFVEVRGTILAGGGPDRTMDTVRVFLDIDGDPKTGYGIDGLGADRMIEVAGHGGIVFEARAWEFDANRDGRDWGGWAKPTGTPAAVGGPRFEAQVDWFGFVDGLAIIATAHTQAWDGQVDTTDAAIAPTVGTLAVSQEPIAPIVLRGSNVPLLQLSMTGVRMPVTFDALTVRTLGTASAPAGTLRLFDAGGSKLSERVPVTPEVQFMFPPYTIAAGATTTLVIVGDFVGGTGATFGVTLPGASAIRMVQGIASLHSLAGRYVGYVDAIPVGPRIDGGFAEWTAVTMDDAGEPSVRGNVNIDLRGHGAIGDGASVYVYADVAGRLFAGTMVPEWPAAAPVTSPLPQADSDRDVVPDDVDPLPFDFDNDGTPDLHEAGDYDSDGILDYGYPGGTDLWLNTTLPASFPAPYAGHGVSLYIGPTNRPLVLGEDVLRFFLDTDTQILTGYAIGGLGADHAVEVRGKDGAVVQAAALRFAGSYPGDWSWTPVAPVTAATGFRAIELVAPFNASSVYVEVKDFWNRADAAVPGVARSAGAPRRDFSSPMPRTGSAPNPPQTLDISGNQQWFFRDTTTTGTGCTTNLAASTTAGSAATSTALSGTSSICWFTPLDQPDTITGTWEVILDIDKTTDGTQALYPNALGDANAWTTFACTEANEYECIDEDPNDGDTTYITSSSSATTDSLFNIQDWSSAPSPLSIVDVVVQGSCRKMAGSSVDVRILVKSGATTSASATAQNCANSPTYTVWSETWTTDPADGSAWTLADINALQIGVRDNDATTRVVRASHVKATVTFVPVYSVQIDKCLNEACSSSTLLSGPTNSNTFGGDVTFAASISDQTVGPTERIRFRVKLEAGGTVTVRYNGANPGTDDSRATVPIPEFAEIVIPFGGVLLIALIVRRVASGRRLLSSGSRSFRDRNSRSDSPASPGDRIRTGSGVAGAESGGTARSAWSKRGGVADSVPDADGR